MSIMRRVITHDPVPKKDRENILEDHKDNFFWLSLGAAIQEQMDLILYKKKWIAGALDEKKVVSMLKQKPVVWLGAALMTYKIVGSGPGERLAYHMLNCQDCFDKAARKLIAALERTKDEWQP